MDASELYDPEFRKLIKSKKQTVIIPVGSLEQHGAHLPITTDSDIVTEIASRLAKKCGFIVFPTINYGVSFEHAPLINASITSDAFIEFLRDILRSLIENKIKSVVILNGHGGNRDALDTVLQVDSGEGTLILPEEYWEDERLEVRYYSYWDFFTSTEFDHAGFVETSIMLAISDKVKMKKAKKGLATKDLTEKEKRRIRKLISKRGGFPKVAKNGVWGDPTGATKKDGEKLLAEIVRNLTEACQYPLTD